MKRQYFGTDGVRAPYGSATMNEDFAWRLGAAAARFAKGKMRTSSKDVFIGRDTRASGPSLESALAAGIASEGFQPISLGIVPTPVVSLLTRSSAAAFGVVITASHNPASDNGIKFFGSNGIKLTDSDESQIEHLLPVSPSVLSDEDRLAQKTDALATYLELTGALLPPDSLQNWKIVLDTANGAACVSSRTVLENLGAELTLIANQPDGQNINADVGSQHPEKMSAAVKTVGARLGIAHDGDADRCILCDENGDVLDGDEILTLLALRALKQKQLEKNTLVITVQSNLGVDAAVQAAGGRVSRTDVGDRYVIERMLAEGATLGGESSGHVICSDISPTGDGLVAALKVIEVMLETGKPLSELRRGLRKFPQLTAALKVKDKKPLESLPTLPAVIKKIESELGNLGRVLVRYSGTEPKLRLLVEGPTDERVQSAMDQLTAATKADLEVV
ncbi:phosphoglucosamine mutase [Oleiharenicola lentus]|uniref:phosphoglucosamine mutase n=1 Tax=Oleiharenicola lentus TaxID=2508720 RepID=UPI003F679786